MEKKSKQCEEVKIIKEMIKQKGWELASHYSGERIRIEINLDKSQSRCKLNVEDHE